MSEEFILHVMPQRVRERGFQRYRLDYADFILQPREVKRIQAYNEIYFLLYADPSVEVHSDYGSYLMQRNLLTGNTYEHGDWIELVSHATEMQQVKFIQVILQE